ncbi:MAG: hypothetical protein KKH68_14835 [Proteobacteria bacterium]|nr:hypothetical protein [Pseudomonadota bacterium]
MTNNRNFVDRRRHKRFKAREGAFAVPKSDANKLGRIKNVSQGGLAFQYTAREDYFEGFTEMDIFLSDDRFYMQQVPVRTILDFEVDNKTPLNSLRLRQRNIQFGDMIPIQKFQLYYFLQHHTTDEV